MNKFNKINSTIDALKWAFDSLHSVATATSFGAEDSVIIDMITRLNPEARFFTLDTGRLNQETYDIKDKLEKKYNIHFELIFPDALEVREMVESKGINLFYDSKENRKLCCDIRKVNPLRRMLSTLDGWITGIRRDQTPIRKKASFIEIDENFNRTLKINPLLDWTLEQVWNYIEENNVPYHELLDKRYSSIGCEPCTRAIKTGEDSRSGRWWWESGCKECGIHVY